MLRDQLRGDAPKSLSTTAMLLLGSFAQPNRAAAAPSWQQLLDHEVAAVAEGSVRTWLEALGNAGRSEALPAARRYLASEDPSLRSGALSAVRRVADPEAARMLRQAAEQDQDRNVRDHARRLLAER